MPRCHPTIVTVSFRALSIWALAHFIAHQAVYTDILAIEHDSDWGYIEVNLIGEQQIADLQQQDLLYTVAEMSADADRSRCWRG